MGLMLVLCLAFRHGIKLLYYGRTNRVHVPVSLHSTTQSIIVINILYRYLHVSSMRGAYEVWRMMTSCDNQDIETVFVPVWAPGFLLHVARSTVYMYEKVQCLATCRYQTLCRPRHRRPPPAAREPWARSQKWQLSQHNRSAR